MTGKGSTTTVQEYKGKFTTSVPMGLVKLLGIKKSYMFIWNMDNCKITIKIVKVMSK